MHKPTRTAFRNGSGVLLLAAAGALVTLAAADSASESQLRTWWFGIAWGLLAIGVIAFVSSFFGIAKPTREEELLQKMVALLERSTDRALSTGQLVHDSGASQREVRQAVAALEGQGRVRLQGQEVTIRVEPAEHDQAMPITPLKSSPVSALAIEGGDGKDFDWTISIMETYRRLERANALVSGEYVVEAARMKVIPITNTSDFGIENARVEVTLNDGKVAANLLWAHNDSEIADIAPHSSRHVVVALWVKLGISPLQEREYERTLGQAALPNGSVLRGQGMGSKHGECHGSVPGWNGRTRFTHLPRCL